MKTFIKRFGLVAMVLGMGVLIAPNSQPTTSPHPGGIASQKEGMDEAAKARVQVAYGKLPLYFIQNDGQVDKKVKFYEKGGGHTTFFTKDGIYINLYRREHLDLSDQTNNPIGLKQNSEIRNSEFIKLTPLGGSKDLEIIAEGLQEGKVNYFIGSDPKNWRTNIPTYQAIVYQEVYPGIDMRFYGNNGQLEYDVIVKPAADPSKIRFSFEGIEGLSVSNEGDLEIGLKEGTISQKKPVIYQQIDGKRVEVSGKYKLLTSRLAYAFEVSSYNKKYPLIIDPVLIYSTYLGASGLDAGRGIAVDSSGNAYVTGKTDSGTFPGTLGSLIQPCFAGPCGGNSAIGSDVFVTKINAVGSDIVYST